MLVFTAAVVVYTTYGGFRAVVWTDVMQGFVMVGGVVLLLPLSIWAVGGLDSATREMAQMTPPNNVRLELTVPESLSEPFNIPNNSWLVQEAGGTRRVFRTAARAQILPGERTAMFRVDQGESSQEIPGIEITYAKQVDSLVADDLGRDIAVRVLESKAYVTGGGQPGVYVTGPGPHASSDAGFLGAVFLGFSFVICENVVFFSHKLNLYLINSFSVRNRFRNIL